MVIKLEKYTLKIVFFITDTQKNPVLDFINKLEKKDQAKIFGCLKSLQELAFETPRVDFRQIDGKLWEIKIRTPSGGYRIFYVTVNQEQMVLLHAYQKKSQKAPKKRNCSSTSKIEGGVRN